MKKKVSYAYIQQHENTHKKKRHQLYTDPFFLELFFFFFFQIFIYTALISNKAFFYTGCVYL